MKTQDFITTYIENEKNLGLVIKYDRLEKLLREVARMGYLEGYVDGENDMISFTEKLKRERCEVEYE